MRAPGRPGASPAASSRASRRSRRNPRARRARTKLARDRRRPWAGRAGTTGGRRRPPARPPPATAPAAVLATTGSPSAAAARADAISPSGCRIVCTPTGASITGAGISVPRTVVRRSRRDTSRSMRGTIRQRRNASRFARIVSPLPAPPQTKSRGPGSTASAARRSSSSPLERMVRRLSGKSAEVDLVLPVAEVRGGRHVQRPYSAASPRDAFTSCATRSRAGTSRTSRTTTARSLPVAARRPSCWRLICAGKGSRRSSCSARRRSARGRRWKASPRRSATTSRCRSKPSFTDASERDLVDRLHAVPDAVRSVMLIGHNPTVHALTIESRRRGRGAAERGAQVPHRSTCDHHVHRQLARARARRREARRVREAEGPQLTAVAGTDGYRSATAAGSGRSRSMRRTPGLRAISSRRSRR